MAKKILIVDDSPAEIAQLRTLLHDAGYDTVTASNGREAVSKAGSEQPSMILMDVVMPDMDGYEACRQLRANPPPSRSRWSSCRARIKRRISCGPACRARRR